MSPDPPGRRPIWSSSFYWRIAISFVGLVIVVLVGQSIMFSYMIARQSGPFAPDNPNAAAAAIATEVSDTLAHDERAPLEDALRAAAADARQGVYLVLKDGRTAANTERPLSTAIRAQVDAVLLGAVAQMDASADATGPVVTAPVQIAGELRGLVVLPPPPRRGVLSEVGRLLSLPGTLILLVAAAAAAVVIFTPARRRLHALEETAERFGAGELTVRAADDGHDEIARLAAAFNRMASELATRTEALRTSDRLRRQMLADVSHELRTPLTAMLGYLDTLSMPEITIDAETRTRYIDTVRRETARLERIVADLLDLAKHEHGVSSLDTRVCAIDRVFSHVVGRYEQQASAAGVTLETHVDEAADQLVADPHRLEQVIGNLVANALRQTPPGGTVRLSAKIDAGKYVLLVEDTGEGMPPEHIEHVFERFYKIDTARSGSGSGLGLSIVKAIVERHGGTISVASRPGHTAFVITVPQGVPEGAPPQSGASANL